MTVWSLFCSAVGLTRAFRSSRLFNPEAYGDWQRDRERDVDIVTGCYLMIDHDLWKRLGGFDRTFFMYAEEADLCLRAAKLGARPAITPAATIVHLGGVSESSRTEKVMKVMRGKATLMRKHWSRPAYLVGRGLLRFWAVTRLYGARLGRKDADKWHAIWSRRAEWIEGY